MNIIACIKAFSNKHPLPASLLGAIAITVFILAGCKTPTSEGIFQGRTAPTVEEPKYISERNAPSQRQDSVTVKIPQGEAELDPLNIVNSGSGVPRGSKVVISLPHLPDSVTKTEAKANESNALSSFRANGFYNQAEQEIEKALLRIGLQAVDRAKFEAKLRELRDSIRNDRDNTDALRELKTQYEKGSISDNEYMQEVARISQSANTAGVRRARGESEIVDISELIRAAQSGDIRADYILQVNNFVIKQSYDRMLDIQGRPEMSEFLGRNPGLRFGQSSSTELPSNISTPWFIASCNAKLIEVATGNIVWIGEHKIESTDVTKDGFTISFDIGQRVTNATAINGEIVDYNSELQELYQTASSRSDELSAIYAQGTSPQKFESKEDLLAWEESMKSKADKALSSLISAVRAYQQFSQRLPDATRTDWEYIYTVNEPRIEPNLAALVKSASDDIQSRERLEKHTRDLARLVNNQLISSIKIKD